MNEVRKIIHLSFPPETSGKPVVCNLTKFFDLCFSILQSQITPREMGEMILEVTGLDAAVQDGIEYLKEHGVTVVPVAQKVRKDEEKCMHCGVCTALCRPKALEVDLNTREVRFDSEKCVACELCIKVCPVQAMETLLDNNAL